MPGKNLAQFAIVQILAADGIIPTAASQPLLPGIDCQGVQRSRLPGRAYAKAVNGGVGQKKIFAERAEQFQVIIDQMEVFVHRIFPGQKGIRCAGIKIVGSNPPGLDIGGQRLIAQAKAVLLRERLTEEAAVFQLLQPGEHLPVAGGDLFRQGSHFVKVAGTFKFFPGKKDFGNFFRPLLLQAGLLIRPEGPGKLPANQQAVGQPLEAGLLIVAALLTAIGFRFRIFLLGQQLVQPISAAREREHQDQP